MKRVQIETKISIDAKIGGKSVDESLRDIADLCHDGLITSEKEKYQELIEREDYASVFRLLENRIESLEGTLCEILDYLED